MWFKVIKNLYQMMKLLGEFDWIFIGNSLIERQFFTSISSESLNKRQEKCAIKTNHNKSFLFLWNINE